MRIAQYIQVDSKAATNKTFQKELWDQIWSQNSFNQLAGQLTNNPIYWRLKKLIKKQDKILEAGCGFGQWVWALSQEGYKITGVDIAKHTVGQLKKTLPDLDVGIADVENLPFKNKSFDVYLSFGVIEHFQDGPEKVLAEANRILKDGGLLFLTVPYLNFFRLLRFGSNSNKQGEFYQYLYSKKEITEKIAHAGFWISSVTHYDFLSAIRKDFPFLFRFLPRIKYSSQSNSALKSNDQPQIFQQRGPNFRFRKFLYKLDSYIILIEAYKSSRK